MVLMNETIQNFKMRQTSEIQASRKEFTDFNISNECWPNEININWKPVILEHARYICGLSPLQKKIITLYTHDSTIFQINSRYTPEDSRAVMAYFLQTKPLFVPLLKEICEQLQVAEDFESVGTAMQNTIIPILIEIIAKAPTANTHLDLYRLETASDYGNKEVPQDFFERRGFYSYNIVRNCVGILNMKCPMLNCYSYLYYVTILTGKSCCLFHHRIEPNSKFLFVRPASGYPVNEVIMHDSIMDPIKITSRGPIKINFKKIWSPSTIDLPYVRIRTGDRCSTDDEVKFFDIQETGEDSVTINFYSTMKAMGAQRKRRTSRWSRKRKRQSSRKARKKIIK